MRLDVRGIHKYFGDNHVLRDVSFVAEPGSALGLLGRNGAGKTTAIRIMMDVFPPDEGEVLFNGRHLRHAGIRVGYLPEERGLYPKIPIGRQLCYLAELQGMPRDEAAHSVSHWLERLDMTEYLDKKLETLSKGNQQKIQLALALLADPDVVILDEPFSGLDPVNAQLLKDIVEEQVDIGKVVLFSSHQMGYVEQFCDRVALLDKGGIVLSGNLREIKRGYPRTRLSVRIAGPDHATETLLRTLSAQVGLSGRIRDVIPGDDGDCEVHLASPEDRDPLLSAILTEPVSVEKFFVIEPTLEQIFVEKVGSPE